MVSASVVVPKAAAKSRGVYIEIEHWGSPAVAVVLICQ